MFLFVFIENGQCTVTGKKGQLSDNVTHSQSTQVVDCFDTMTISILVPDNDVSAGIQCILRASSSAQTCNLVFSGTKISNLLLLKVKENAIHVVLYNFNGSIMALMELM